MREVLLIGAGLVGAVIFFGASWLALPVMIMLVLAYVMTENDEH